MSDWRYIDELNLEKFPSVRFDTRDFFFIELTDVNLSEYGKVLKYPDRFCRSREFAEEWIKNLEVITGGKAEWRLLNFSGIKYADYWEMKYTQLISTPQGYIVTNRLGKAIKWDDLIESNIDKDALQTHNL